MHIHFLVYYIKFSVKLWTVFHALKKSYLWQESEMDLWWDQDISQHWPGRQQSWTPVLFAALKWETMLCHTVFFKTFPFIVRACNSKLGYLPPRSSSKVGTYSSTFSVLLFPAITVQSGEWTSFKAFARKPLHKCPWGVHSHEQDRS